MAGFDSRNMPTRIIDPGMRSYSGTNGTISADWQRFNNWPPESGGFAANESAPFTNVFKMTTTGGSSGPCMYWQNAFIQNGRTPHRASASVRIVDTSAITSDNYSSGGQLLLVYGSRLLGDAISDFTTLSISLNVQNPLGPGGGGIGRGRISLWHRTLGTQEVNADLAVSANNYHRIGVEVIGRQITAYWDPTAADDPNDLTAGDSALVPYTQLTLSVPYPFEGPNVFIGAGVFAHYSAVGDIAGAVTDIIIEELETPPSDFAGPGAGEDGDSDFPLPWGDIDVPELPDISGIRRGELPGIAYRRYKSMRRLMMSVNNLQVGP